jgi:hypothetical protein
MRVTSGTDVSSSGLVCGRSGAEDSSAVLVTSCISRHQDRRDAPSASDSDRGVDAQHDRRGRPTRSMLSTILITSRLGTGMKTNRPEGFERNRDVSTAMPVYSDAHLVKRWASSEPQPQIADLPFDVQNKTSSTHIKISPTV